MRTFLGMELEDKVILSNLFFETNNKWCNISANVWKGFDMNLL
jgi:hypothetical protein